MTAPDRRWTAWIFVRVLGAIYAIAFASLWIQIRGLAGANGILPASHFVAAARQFVDAGAIGLDRYRLLPTFAWIGASDTALAAQCAAGTALGVLVAAGLAPGPCLALAWALYLSLATAGQDFFGFQWDSLLLEAGLLAVALAPWRWVSRPARDPAPSPVVVWLLRWLLFRLMFESGCVKLASGDPSWRSLTALTVHYQTQPLPTWIGWYAHQLPAWCQRASCAGVFAVELGAPWLIFTPRRSRLIGAAALAGLQVLILLTGNYAFFNVLTLALCLLLLDDAALAALRPGRGRRRRDAADTPESTARTTGAPAATATFPVDEPAPATRPAPAARGARLARWSLAAVVVPVSLTQVMGTVGWTPAWIRPAETLGAWLAPFRSINPYGLFAVMTTTRREIEIEGSDDGVTWRAYGFPYKPGDPARRPAFVAPYQPRLDWQMWFAALESPPPWFEAFCARLLEGSPEVLGLLATNPFPEHPPRFVRAELYEYRFTTWAERRATGDWWVRTPVGEYLSPVTLRR